MFDSPNQFSIDDFEEDLIYMTLEIPKSEASFDDQIQCQINYIDLETCSVIEDGEETFTVELKVKESYLFFGKIEEQEMELSIKLNNPNYIEISEVRFGLKVYQ